MQHHSKHLLRSIHRAYLKPTDLQQPTKPQVYESLSRPTTKIDANMVWCTDHTKPAYNHVARCALPFLALQANKCKRATTLRRGDCSCTFLGLSRDGPQCGKTVCLAAILVKVSFQGVTRGHKLKTTSNSNLAKNGHSEQTKLLGRLCKRSSLTSSNQQRIVILLFLFPLICVLNFSGLPVYALCVCIK